MAEFINPIRDNREILRYRGILTPDKALLESQDQALRFALLSLADFNTNIRSRFSSLSDSNSVAIESNPFMRLLPSDGGRSTDTIYDFYFPYTPQQIDYSDMSDEVSEIRRVGTTPIITFSSHRLMKVSMEFLVAVPYDGLLLDVEDSLNILRTFSTSSHRSVVFYHLDEFLTSGWSYRSGSGRPSGFNITDMSITARQRNASGKITQAIVKMSLIENQNPSIVASKIPPFKKKPPKKKPPRKPKTPGKLEKEYTSDAKTEAAQGG